MCLVIDSNKPKGDGRFGFVDIIFGDVNYSIIELKYINLSGLIKAMHNNWNTSPSTSNLATLDRYIKNEDEITLLERKFMFWSKKDNKPKLKTLNDLWKSRLENIWMQFHMDKCKRVNQVLWILKFLQNNHLVF